MDGSQRAMQNPIPETYRKGVHVWWRDTSQQTEQDLVAALRELSDDERARCRQLRFADDRRDFAAAHHLLREALTLFSPDRAPADWKFTSRPSGKPEVSSDDVLTPRFSLSHTRGLVACAVATSEVGIDVETVRPDADWSEIAEMYFSQSEKKALRDLPVTERKQRFIELWTLKEAFLKGLGCGLSGPLSEISFNLTDPGAPRCFAPDSLAADQWSFHLFTPVPQTRMALAVRGFPHVEIHNLP